MPALTIGMAVYNDFNGVYFTVQALRMYHNLADVELVVVDNNPDTQEGKAVRTLIENYAYHWTAGARYIPYTEKTGTSAPRQKIFEEAKGDAVMCIDSHILIAAGAIDRLLAYYRENPETRDILSGPMVLDALDNYHTQFDDTWRAEMWGIWGTDPRAAFPVLPPWPGKSPIPARPDQWTEYDHCPAFEIPAMGLGLFSCRREAWLGFNPNFSGFGGEEFYIHNKFRQAGHKALCLPFLRWLHRFPRPGGLPYPLTRWQKIRNYVIGHQELGLPLDRLYDHFVKPNPSGASLFSEQDWAYLLADPINHDRPYGTPAPCNTCPPAANGQPIAQSNLLQPPEGSAIDQMYEIIKATPRGLDKHMPKLRELASQCPRIVEFSKQRESTLALLAGTLHTGKPAKFISWNREQDVLISQMHKALGQISSDPEARKEFTTGDGTSLVTDIPECDLLYLDTFFTADRILAELKMYGPKVKKYIAIFSTGKFGEIGAQNGPGLLPGLREYLKSNPNWRVIYHTDEQDGLTVISCDPADTPKLPSTAQMAFNYAGFLTKHLVTGGAMATEEIAHIRLDTCGVCTFRTADSKNPELPRCSKCGCFLAETSDGRPGKALFKAAVCPLGFWQTAEQLGSPIIPQAGQPVT